MSVSGGWLLAPLVLMLLCTGAGLLIERAWGRHIPGALLPAAGLAGTIVLAGPFTLLDATAELAAPAVALAAAAGIAVSAPWRDPRLRAAWPWPLLVAAGAYALFAAPSLLSGQASIAGYVRLDDSATWLALVDQVMTHGRDLSGLQPSTYRRTLEVWLGGGYPVGALLPLGVVSKLTAQDPANAYASTIAVYGAILALGLYACARSLVTSRGLPAAAALVAVQASLLYGYAQWGAIKEVATAALLPLLAYAAVAAGRPGRVPGPALACVAAGALVAILGLNGLAWAGPALLLAAVIWWRAGEGARRLALGAGLVALLALAALPALAEIDFLRQTTAAGGAIRSQDELGNLIEPLSLLQGAGLWPAGDFRIAPDPLWPAVALALVVLAAALGGLALAARRRARALVALAAIAFAGALPAIAIGSPWIDAKALATVSPVLLLCAAALVAAGLGAAAERGGRAAAPAGGAGRGGRIVALAGAVVLTGGCAASTVVVVRDVQVAPRERLAELRAIAGEIAGEGPTVVLDYEIYAGRHFLRDAGAEGATDLRYRQVARSSGGLFDSLTTAEVDEIATPDLWVYRTIVRRRSPAAGRPPSAYRRSWAKHAWEVWQRDPAAPAPLARLALGTPLDPAAVPDCERIRALARTPGARTIAAVAGRLPALAPISPRDLSDGEAQIAVSVPVAGRWRLWVGGSAKGRLRASVGGLDAGSVRHELSHPGQWLRLRSVRIAAGATVVRLTYDGDDHASLGPIALTPLAADGEQPVIRLAPRDAGRLCDGRRYDWIEVLG